MHVDHRRVRRVDNQKRVVDIKSTTRFDYIHLALFSSHPNSSRCCHRDFQKHGLSRQWKQNITADNIRCVRQRRLNRFLFQLRIRV